MAVCTGAPGAGMLRSPRSTTTAASRREAALLTIDLANTIFIVCLLVGGVLLLVTVLLDDILGGLLDFLHLDFDLGGVSLMPLLLAFVAMFGVGGLIGTEVLQVGPGQASLVGGVAGIAGAGLVFVIFGFLRRAEAPQAFSLDDLVGQAGRVAVAIPAGRYGSVLLSYAGSSHNLTATADLDIPAGTPVTVVEVAGGMLVVRPVPVSSQGESHA
jgi:membrane protein implicated in regulation of membrane protease activity